MEQNKTLTLGSLFDGSGGFPLGGLISGIRPVWASEIEPFPIRVTTKRMPFVKHYGDVSTMDGAKLEPVDIITFGSPCQDMSIAGKRSGLDGSRSSLFYEAIRIIKEMRCATNGKYPRYCVWENVPGAFSSNKGEDFKAVLEAVIGVVEPGPQVPAPEKKRWPYADCYMGDGWSVAYRVLDAQFWGVPQRRKRIYLVADFAGRSAFDILFKSEGVSGYSAQGFRSWQRAAGIAETGVGAAGRQAASAFDGYNGELTGSVSSTLGVNCGMSTGRNGIVLNDQGCIAVAQPVVVDSVGGQAESAKETEVCPTLKATHYKCAPVVTVPAAGFCTEHSAKSRSIGYEEETAPTLRAGVVPAAVALENHPTDSRVKISEGGKVQTLTSRMGTGGNNVPLVLKIRSGCDGGGKGALIQEDKSATLSCNNDQVAFVPFCKSTRPHSAEEGQSWKEAQVANTLNTFDVGEGRCNELAVQAFGISSKDSNGMKSANPHVGFYEADASRTLDGNGGNPGCNQGGIAVVESYAIQGSMIGRKDENGPQGDGINEDVSFTLNTADRHAVYAATVGCYLQTVKEQSPTLMARDYKDPTVVNCGYTVRRLTPTECARLQGFPDWWCVDLGTPEPTMEDIRYWYDVFETHRRIMGPSTKPKTLKQITKWLRNPHSDSAEYKMWGNGVALPCVVFVLSGIVWSTQSEGR